MTEPRIATWAASDGYPIHVASWPTSGPPRGRVVVLHGVGTPGRGHPPGTVGDRAGVLPPAPEDVPDPPERPRPVHRQPRGSDLHRRGPARPQGRHRPPDGRQRDRRPDGQAGPLPDP